MAKLLTPGVVTGVLSCLAVVAGFFGKDALAVFLNDPATAQTVLTLAGSAMAILAGVLSGIRTESQ